MLKNHSPSATTVPLRVTVKLVIDKESSNKAIKEIKEQEVYMGGAPVMTENGTFIINGTERVIVSSFTVPVCSSITIGARPILPGSCSTALGRFLIVVPGSSSNSIRRMLLVRIDCRRKLPASVLMRALGYDTEEIRCSSTPIPST